MGKGDALKTISESIKYAKDLDLKVRFTPEDATRTEWNYLSEVLDVAREAGADRISIADTVGTALPTDISQLVKKARKRINIPLHVHCHNDYGMAVSNALAGYEAGAYLIDVTVNGLGERVGITPMAPLVVALKMLYKVDNEWKLELLPELSRLVEKASGIFNSEQSPVVGEHAFSHKAGLHTQAVLEDPRTYEAFPPEIVHKQRKIIIDKYTGKAAVKNRLNEMGIEPREEELSLIVQKVKEKAGKGRFTDIDLLEIADEILELELRSKIPLGVEAIVSIALNSASHTTRVTRKIAALEEVDQVYEITGESDILAHLETKSIQELNEIIEEFRVMDGVRKTSTSLILKGYEQTNKSR
jgi:2-isopropylmalate synthase